MKRFLCLLLVLVMVSSLCACKSSDDEYVPGEISTNEPSSEDFEKETEPQFSLGTSTGNTYNSEFLGLTVTIPDGWKVCSDEEILQINNITKEYIDEEALELIENASLLYDMYATNESDGSSVSIILEKVSALQMLTLDQKAVLESQFDTLTSTCENAGYTDIDISYKKITVDGKELDGYELSASIYGMTFRMVGLSFVRGSYLVSVTIGSFGENGVDELLRGFDFK